MGWWGDGGGAGDGVVVGAWGLGTVDGEECGVIEFVWFVNPDIVHIMC